MSNIQPYSRIMLVDGQTKYNLEHNPSLEKLFRNDFKICQIKDLSGNEIVKLDHHEIKISETEYNAFYAPSNLYKNVYYPLDRYNEMYQKDMNDIIVGLASRMGAKSILYSRREEECQIDTIQIEKQFKLTIDLQAAASLLSLCGDLQGLGFIKPMIDRWTEPIPLEIDKSRLQEDTKKEENVSSSEQQHSKLSYEPKSKEELQTWISQKGINIKALPSSFLLHLEQYLEGGKSSGNTMCEDNISRVVTENVELNSTLSIVLPNLPKFIDILNKQSKMNKYYRLLKTRYEIEF